MPAAGVEPNDRTLKVLNNKSERRFAKMQKRKLRDLLKAGNVASARALMDKMKDEVANVVHFSVMLLACEGSAKMRRVIETEMPAAGLKPNVVTFTTLVTKLMTEKDLAGAQRVVEDDMPAAGMEPDDRTLSVLKKS